MKLKATLAIAALALAPGLHAFTLDFASSVGQTLPPSLVVNVPGYGDVSFTAGFNAVLGATSTLTVGTEHGLPALNFHNGDTVFVSFLGALPSNVSFSEIGIAAGSAGDFIVLQTGQSDFVISLQNAPEGGIYRAQFTADAVPEPASSMLGVLGLTGLAIRRRR